MSVAAFLQSYGDLYATAVLLGMYCAIGGAVRQPASPVLDVLSIVFMFGIATCVAMWTVRDARTRRCTPCFDFGTFVFFTWFISMPYYLIATRGWHGLLIIVTAIFTMFVIAIGFVLVFVFAGFVH